MRVLITGISGFVGRHLIDYLLHNNADDTYFGTTFRASPNELPDTVDVQQLDLLDAAAVRACLQRTQPDAIYHLAAQASAGRSINAAWETLEVNIRGQLNIIEACLQLNIKPRMLIASSAEIYSTATMPITEQTALRAKNPYGLSKITQDLMGLQYHISHGLPIIRTRSFNQFGPRQRESFVAPDFALQVARVEAGLQDPVMYVGNLSAHRDFTDIRDTVRAYTDIMRAGIAGEAYNVASNSTHSIQEVLDTLLSLSKANIDVRVDPEKLRPVDVPIIRGDYTRLHQLTGWQPEIPFEQTLHDLLDDCRQRVKKIQRSNKNNG